MGHVSIQIRQRVREVLYTSHTPVISLDTSMSPYTLRQCMCMTWSVHMWDMTHSYHESDFLFVWHHSFNSEYAECKLPYTLKQFKERSRLVDILKSQLATQFTRLTHYRTDFWEYLPVPPQRVPSWCAFWHRPAFQNRFSSCLLAYVLWFIHGCICTHICTHPYVICVRVRVCGYVLPIRSLASPRNMGMFLCPCVHLYIHASRCMCIHMYVYINVYVYVSSTHVNAPCHTYQMLET